MAHIDQPQYHLNAVICGTDNVGKTSLVRCYKEQDFDGHYIKTIGVDFEVERLIVDDQNVKYKIWDTPGHSQFRQILSHYYWGAGVVMVAYDITNMDSFKEVTYYTDLVELNWGAIPILIVGCKGDLKDARQVPYETAHTFATNNGYTLIETSAKTGENVEQAFVMMVTMHLQYRQQ